MPADPYPVVVERIGPLRIRRRPDLPAEAVLEALREPGETLKRSDKAHTRRVGPWVVKESLPGLRAAVKHTVRRSRYRQGWRAAVHLQAAGVCVPTPRAFVERSCGGLVFGNVLVTDYLEGCENVEVHARRLAEGGADRAAVWRFLQGIARSVNALVAAGACHTDLSGKNIFTGDGETFWFIDLDGVEIGRPYTQARRFENHVQLYDSFCDLWGDDLLGPFLSAMLPPELDPRIWMDAVEEAQARRRARTEARRRCASGRG